MWEIELCWALLSETEAGNAYFPQEPGFLYMLYKVVYIFFKRMVLLGRQSAIDVTHGDR